MAAFFTWLMRIFSGLLFVAVLGLFGIYWLAARSVPDYDADYSVSGVTAPVEIVRDNASVPHIFGQTDADVFFGLGFAHAQDRLWQMSMLRRTAQGRLSEIFGTRTLQSDALMRRFDFYRLAGTALEAQDPQTRSALDAYASGVNHWIDIVNAKALGRGAPEFFVFDNALAPWRPVDSLAVAKLMAFRMTDHLQREVRRARLSLVMPENRLADLMPDIPGPGVAALPKYADLMPGLVPGGTQVADLDDPMGLFLPIGQTGASNAWAASPARSASGGALLANDPHIALSAPTMWYLAHLELSSGGVIGATWPGMPVVLAGRNTRLGWGLTSAYVDDQDLAIEELNPADPQKYRTPDGWKAFESRPSILHVADAKPVTLTLRWSDNGPILPGDQFGIRAITPPGHVAALNWTALARNDTTMSGYLRLMQAPDTDAALAAGRLIVAPAQNLVVADSQGAVAMQTSGAIPRRDAKHQTQGRLPALGWRPENRWMGTFNQTANPRFSNPVGGIVGNTNNKIVNRPFPLHVSFDWGDTQRVHRWQRLMQMREVHTRESFIEAQLDTVSNFARTVLPLVARDLWFTGDPAAEGTPERMRQEALTLMANWNGEMNEHLPEPLIFSAWMRALQDRLIRDELGPLADTFAQAEPLFLERVYRDTDGAAAWCDVIQSSVVESCTDTARTALDIALRDLRETWGGAIESWRWGDAHEAHHDHRELGQVPVLSWFVNIRQSTSGGDHTLNRAISAGTGAQPFANIHAAGYRGVYDLADPDSSVFITATGQSGHPLSRHYDDLGDLWRRGEYIPMSLDPELARAAAAGVTLLTPRQ